MIDLSKYSEQFKAIADRPTPACFCGECDNPELLEEYFEEGEEVAELATFDCEGCKREMPWCYGADDHLSTGESLFDYCDDCAAVIVSDREDDSWKKDALAIAEVFGVSTRR
jgi:hypothetical protein